MIDVINYNNEERSIFTSTEFEYLPGKPEGYLHATQQRVDPGICGGPPGAFIHPPKGQSRFSVKSQNIVAIKNGYIVNASRCSFNLLAIYKQCLLLTRGTHA